MLRRISLLLVAGVSVFLLSSCKKNTEEAGLVIQPDENRLKVFTATLNDFDVYTSQAKPVNTKKDYISSLLGSVTDDIFGKSSSAFVSQFRLQTGNVDFGTDARVVSVAACLEVKDYEGDLSTEMTYKVYKSTQTINDTLYPSNTSFEEYAGDLVGESTFSSESDSQIKIPLFDSFGQEILDAEDQLVDNSTFLSEFKGLCFAVDTNISAPGLLWRFNFNTTSKKSYIELVYESKDNAGVYQPADTIKFLFSNASERFNIYTHSGHTFDFTTSPKQQVFVAGLGNTDGNINLSPVLTYRDSSRLMIYKAELLVPADTLANFSYPSGMKLARIGEGYVDDNSGVNYGGKYGEGYYSMVITRHVQNLINKAHSDTLLKLIPSAPNVNPTRVILNNTNDQPIRLKLTYSKLN